MSIIRKLDRPLGSRGLHGHDMTWLQFYYTDIARYKQYRTGASLLNLLFTQQGLWALLNYRIASAVYNAGLPNVIKCPCLYGLGIWQKVVEVLAGISISHEARIGPGFYIGHFGHIFIGKDAKIGAHCSISHGVTLGESGRGAQRGTPQVGDRVVVGANAVLAGKISIGDDAVIAPNSLVIYDVSKSSVMMGVPAKCFSKAGSRDILFTGHDGSGLVDAVPGINTPMTLSRNMIWRPANRGLLQASRRAGARKGRKRRGRCQRSRSRHRPQRVRRLLGTASSNGATPRLPRNPLRSIPAAPVVMAVGRGSDAAAAA